MKFKEFDTVKILKDGKNGVKKGDVGAILVVFATPREAYEVEVLDEQGIPKAQCTFLPEELEVIVY
jgi:hypothetical protein